MFEAIKVNNKWKWLFFILAIINVGVILWLLLLVYLPTSSVSVPKSMPFSDKRAEFTVISSKDNLNQIINSYLTEISDTQSIDYSVSLEDDVELTGTIVAFDKELPLTMKFEPVVQKNGDLILQQKSITLGRLHLPNKKVLDYIKDNYPMPEWIIVNPDEENVYVAVTQINPGYELGLRASTFNLKKDQLAFELTVPHETFGFSQSSWLKKLIK